MRRALQLLFFTILIAQNGFAKMAAQTVVPTDKVISTLGALEKSQKINNSQKKTLVLTRIGRDALGMTGITVYGGNSDEQSLLRLQAGEVGRSVTRTVKQQPSWDQKVSQAAIDNISTHRALLMEVFGPSSYTFAWFRYKLGEKTEARKMLTDLYEGEYQKVIKLEEAVYGLRGTPLSDAQDYLQALEPMSDESTRKKIRQQMQKMKIHVSNLPQSHIKT